MLQLVLIEVLFIHFLNSSPLTINCEDGNTAKEIENCLLHFKEYYIKGVSIFTQVNSSMVDFICSKYEGARSCLVMYMHFCVDIRKRFNLGVKSFEYACTADRTGEWPYSPTLIPVHEIDEGIERKNAVFYDDLIKISIAAFMTLLLIIACAITELTMKLRIRHRVKRPSAAASASDQDAMLKKSAEIRDAKT